MNLHLSSKRLLAVITFCLVCGLVPNAAFAEMRIFELEHRPAGGIADQVRNLLGDDARVAAHQNTLVVNAAENLDAVTTLVNAYDRAQKMLKITIDQSVNTVNEQRDTHVSGRVGLGSVSVGVGSFGDGVNSSVWYDSGRSAVGVYANDSQRQENRRATQFLSVLDGSPAKLSVGRAVPFTSQLRSYYRRHPSYIETVDYHNVDTGFEVLPEISGELVRLTIRPFMAFLDVNNPGHVVFHDLATTVTIPFGAWYELGGHAGVMDGLSREILKAGQGVEEGTRRIRLRVDPE
jgi:hypothetical protein